MFTHRSIVETAATEAGITQREADRCIAFYLDGIEESLKSKGSVRLPGFGTILVRKQKRPVFSKRPRSFYVGSFRLAEKFRKGLKRCS